MTLSSPTGGRRRLPSADRRQQILDGSEHLFTTRGFEAVNMGDVARHVGVSRPTIYSYFTSTTDILAELLGQRLEEFETRLAPLLAEIRSGQQDRPFAAIYTSLVQERSLLTLLQSGSGPAFTHRRQQVFADLENRLHAHLPSSGPRVPYLLTCVTLLIHSAASHAVSAELSAAQNGQFAVTLDRLLNVGVQAFSPAAPPSTDTPPSTDDPSGANNPSGTETR
ncbi:TetR family transcriptional regulator [Deinococcus seoulensis]|uniref:TetR family transcriptional regulator n=1 Tax=Deinococcus seoulensis TaxID=1837379 RepID=A0ABQ2RPU5_9DEIO|nr:TetR/AcrR family transcriptional regulator [Deinococcus seoulensis]GGR50815.1 TetR family transcriptional regulator [Deinococcus seoulensis]